MPKKQKHRSREMKRIHIVGSSPRSGTTLLNEVMAVCFEIDSYAAYENPIYDWNYDAEIQLSKWPTDILRVAPLIHLMPNLYFVYCIRDPRDSVVSRHRADKEKYWTTLTYFKNFAPIGKKFQDHPRFITVRYEEFVSNPDKVQRDLMERMPFLKKRADFSRFHEIADPSEASIKALRGTRPIKPVSVGSWRKHLPRVAGQLELHGDITPMLIEYGYEKDDSWKQALDGIQPDTSPSHSPEFLDDATIKQRLNGHYRRSLYVLLRQFSIGRFLLRRFGISWRDMQTSHYP